MRKLIIASAIVIPLLTTSATFAAQVENPEAPPTVQVQANPPGPGPATMTPPDPATANTPVAPALPADPSYNAGPYKGALTPPPPQAMGKSYPLCTSRLQDSCVNPSEAQGRQTRVAAKRRSAIRRQ